MLLMPRVKDYVWWYIRMLAAHSARGVVAMCTYNSDVVKQIRNYERGSLKCCDFQSDLISPSSETFRMAGRDGSLSSKPPTALLTEV